MSVGIGGNVLLQAGGSQINKKKTTGKVNGDNTTGNSSEISASKAAPETENACFAETDGVILELSEEGEAVTDSRKTDKTDKEEENEKLQKQLKFLKDMLERVREAQKNAKENEPKTKKVLNYSYKKVSSNIQSAKSIPQASNAISSANSNLSALRRKAASGNYDEDELNIAISHAKRMINIAKKKLAYIKQEVLNKKNDDIFISAKKEEVVKISDEKIRALQQREQQKIEAEIRKQEKQEELAHRGEESNGLLDADMAYIKAKIEIWKRGGGDLGIMMSQSQGATFDMNMTQTLTEAAKLTTEQIELAAQQNPTGQTEIAASINLSV